MRRCRNVKIVATLGPASASFDMIKALFNAGADVFRLNMSHGSHAELKLWHSLIRKVEKDVARPICILADLQGPKLRCGTFKNGTEILEVGDSFRFDLDETAGDKTRACLPHKEIFQAMKPTAQILVNDGKIRMQVKTCGADFADCEVLAGGEISNRKGVNVPDVVLPISPLTLKDQKDLEFACDLGVEWLALSFVQRPEDVAEARTLAKGRASILSKIEKPAAVHAFDAILEASDAIMIARGDLGVELPVQDVPPLQKQIIGKCRHVGKPVIVATQMLESMITSSVPTRAEVSDVATAIYEGADAVMLSAESAVGDFPIEAVQTMNSVAEKVESDDMYRKIIASVRKVSKDSIAQAITVAAREIAELHDVRAICCFTFSGTTALSAAREKPIVPIIALTPFLATARKMCLVWGLHCVITDDLNRFKQAVINAAKAARDYDFATGEDKIIVIAGIPFNTPGSTNILRVASVNEKLLLVGD